MKKLVYLFVMMAGMTLASVNVNAQDAKGKAAPAKETTAACCKSGDKSMCGKCGSKETTAATCTKKDAGTASVTGTAKGGACCKAAGESTVSKAKVEKTVN